MTAEELCAVLSTGRFNLHWEKDTQDDIERHLGRHMGIRPIPISREHRLGRGDIPDFFIDGVVIEVKLRAPRRRILDQLLRYAAHDEVREIILMTNTAIDLPATIGGKPAYCISLGAAWL